MQRVIGLDLGGANLKLSDGQNRSLSQPFPIWREVDRLSEVLAGLLEEFDAGTIALTMTAELADCFESKQEGVRHLVDVVREVGGSRSLHVWQTAGEFVDPQTAVEFPLLTAAANWHALATWAARTIPEGDGLLLDVGSTTTDVIPIRDGLPIPSGRTDRERLMSGELVYSGVRRTPVCSVVRSVPYEDGHCPLAAEVFATTADVHLLCGDLPADENCHDTADGRPFSIAAARQRLSRMLCSDTLEIGETEMDRIAQFIADVQRQRICGAVQQVARATDLVPRVVLTSGEGEFLARRVTHDVFAKQAEPIEELSLTQMLGAEHSTAACAYALAQLATERL